MLLKYDKKQKLNEQISYFGRYFQIQVFTKKNPPDSPDLKEYLFDFDSPVDLFLSGPSEDQIKDLIGNLGWEL